MTPTLLADENFPGLVIHELRSAGYDVLAVAEVAPGIGDHAVLALACDTGRVPLSFDADFGDLVFFHGAPAPPAILYFRMHPIIVEEVFQAALNALREVPSGHFVVVGHKTVRLRPLLPGLQP